MRWTTSATRDAAGGAGFCFVGPVGYRLGVVTDILINAALMVCAPKSVKKGPMALAPLRRVCQAVLHDLGLPEDMMNLANHPTRFDRREILAALKRSGLASAQIFAEAGAIILISGRDQDKLD